ncbi:MAG: hypothetical protein DME25_01815 [Verrucomicrobia bacterium]|nr:MAG: hypothetical protein DME25_01815 [Verrucomicrobiota bacterium]
MLRTSVLTQADAKAPAEDRMSFLDNRVLRLGANLSLGGAITYLSASNSRTNLVNSHDWGRQIQMSHYSGPVPFAPHGKQPNKTWAGLGWNPIQCGDCYGNRSKILAHRNDGRELYVKCRPMQWPLDNEPGECTFECWIRLQANTAQVRCRLLNQRSDKTQYAGRGQELPAVYTCGPWHHLMTYTNDLPFTGGALAEIPDRFPWSGISASAPPDRLGFGNLGAGRLQVHRRVLWQSRRGWPQGRSNGLYRAFAGGDY